jgi:photosystem II stability/assembly factor-like uncharacterized protein
MAPWGTWLAVGYWGYLARSSDGANFSVVADAPAKDWILDAAAIAPQTWVVVGDRGQLLRSTDDARNFSVQSLGDAVDLYAVAFRDESVGLAVGRAGAAFLTRDGGQLWIDCSTGIDRSLGDIGWLADGTALVVGESGTALRLDPDQCGAPNPAPPQPRPHSKRLRPSQIKRWPARSAPSVDHTPLW